MIHETILVIIIAFVINALLCPTIIPFLHELESGQQIRDDGPESHLKKQGTSTIGGLTILSSITITSVFYIFSYPKIIPVLFITVGFGIIGFLDDYIKTVMKRFGGPKPMQKLVGQFIITGIFAWYLLNSGEVRTNMLTLFTGGFDGGSLLSLGILFVSAPFLIMLGTDNGVDFTDGPDGLCISVIILVATFLIIVVIGEDAGISSITGAAVGSLLGFLLLNVYPAKAFMGDTGSLALGGFAAVSYYMMRMPLFIPVIGPIYSVEALSVIIQVIHFKRTGGECIFKMMPTHHHFELCGWSETRAATVSAIVTAILRMVTYLGLQMSVPHVRDRRTVSKCS